MSEKDIASNKILNSLIKALSATLPKARVGIIGSNKNRKDGLTNAEVGAFHEFGTTKIPQRSFLRVPLSMHYQKMLERATFDKRLSITDILNKMGAAGKAVVQEAFTNGGFGQWEPTKKYVHTVLAKEMPEKHAGNILVDTGQLRDSIEWDIT